ncbi:MAG TPA: hypothetical protein VHT96_08065 [Clostridia bacterium]|nr:hypothetical protein [Clostridia bacterium]
MLNSTDTRATVKTLFFYTIAITIFILGFDAFNHLRFIAATPQIKAILALLLIIAISFLKIPTDFSFLICGILGSFIMGIPLSKYTEFLYKEASSTSIFMMAVSGAVIAAVSRNDILDALKQTNRDIEPERYADLEQQASVFCLFSRLQGFIQKVKRKSRFLAAVVFLLQNVLLFVSSVVAAQTFSAMFKSGRKKSAEETSYINAGILCMCVSGCLLVFFFMKSPWWLFFLGLAKDVPVEFPIAVLIYAFFSFIHGYHLITKGENLSSAGQEKAMNKHPLAGRHFLIYLGLIVVFLVFTLPGAISYIASADAAASSGGAYSSSDYINLGISLAFVIIVAAIVAAVIITRKLMLSNRLVQGSNNTINEMKDIILGDKGIKSVISLIILVVTILSFRDMIKLCVGSAGGAAPQAMGPESITLFGTDGIVAIFGCLAVLAVVALIGWILGSNFGAFSIGWIVFGIISAKVPVLNNEQVKRWVLESIILVSTLCNQTSPQSTNAGPLVETKGEQSRNIQIGAWKAKSYLGLSALKVQSAAAVVCVIVSGVLTGFGIR